MPVEWRRLSDISPKTDNSFLCARCLDPTPFEECWTVVVLSVDGKQMLPGYIHCGKCRKTVPMTAWMEAHAKDPH
jgi:hypothetical protein